mmetsp:Transcript_15728/g.63341  ORF Transcript_15728/g.63341 Transcript_15728/m.63341 type:complete len:298 (+) Transcript_15728:140-1033(+)
MFLRLPPRGVTLEEQDEADVLEHTLLWRDHHRLRFFAAAFFFFFAALDDDEEPPPRRSRSGRRPPAARTFAARLCFASVSEYSASIVGVAPVGAGSPSGSVALKAAWNTYGEPSTKAAASSLGFSAHAIISWPSSPLSTSKPCTSIAYRTTSSMTVVSANSTSCVLIHGGTSPGRNPGSRRFVLACARTSSNAWSTAAPGTSARALNRNAAPRPSTVASNARSRTISTPGISLGNSSRYGNSSSSSSSSAGGSPGGSRVSAAEGPVSSSWCCLTTSGGCCCCCCRPHRVKRSSTSGP